MSKKDFYEVLGVSKTATEQEIKAAYRKLAMQYHPDKLKDGTSDQKMQELNEAYEVLSDKEKRANYDRFGNAEGQPNFGGMNFGGMNINFGDFSEDLGDIFGNFFSGFGNFGRKKQKPTGPIRGEDIEAEMRIGFLDAVHGKKIQRTLTKYELCDECNGTGAKNPSDVVTCPDCNGQGVINQVLNTPFGQQMVRKQCAKCGGKGKIIKDVCPKCHGSIYIKKSKIVTFNINPGTQTGEGIKLDGYGQPGENGGPAGDMIVRFVVSDHPYFKQRGLDLMIELPVSFLDVIKENTIKIPSPYGAFDLKLKNSYNNGETLNIKGKGIVKGNRAGDLIIKLSIVMPKLSSREMKKMATSLEDFNDDTNTEFIKKIDKLK
ncbi:DnaJ C-terminal domain-containing protein [Mycoplasmopsis iners]|uniref:DnaJ C-terminal domain-containing protein n=1 Tax=Mycoplasmopsis iners TaxID=76630 RepID=UPI0004983C54|nr:DnaJ C-terminal domain-containing protein [Mycoplasmopsis iners]